jgi:Zn-dependent peptidase ImmA (M78 family)
MRRLPRTVLADQVSFTAAAITQFERGDARPTRAAAGELALALGVPVEFFGRGRPIDTVPAGSAHFRSLRSAPAISRDQALAFAELALAAVDLLEQYVDFPTYSVPLNPVDEDPTPDEIEGIAYDTRVAIGQKDEPLPHVVRLLESKGVVVLRPPMTLDSRVDAFSTRVGGRALVLLSDAKGDRARSRFDAAHELGHLVMHPDVEPGSKLVERQGQIFGSEFLAPSRVLVPELPSRIDWAVLHRLKAKWGISLRALAYRAHASGTWSDATYRRSMQMLAEQGLPESGALGPAESPSMVGAAADLIVNSGMTFEELANAGKLPREALDLVVSAGREDRLRLNLAP